MATQPDYGLPDTYGARYTDMLTQLQLLHPDHKDELAAFWPLRGHRYIPGQGLMVIGRAVNGWDVPFRVDEVRDAARREAVVAAARALSERDIVPGGCPMSWVVSSAGNREGYNTNRSAFWRVTRKVVRRIVPGARLGAWSSYICWSDLYRLAPAERGNPPEWLALAQQATCAELLRLELETWQPARVLLLTGADWFAPFGQALGLPMASHSGRFVQAVADGLGARWVIARHPMGKPEAAFVEEVVRGFEVL